MLVNKRRKSKIERHNQSMKNYQHNISMFYNQESTNIDRAIACIARLRDVDKSEKYRDIY